MDYLDHNYFKPTWLHQVICNLRKYYPYIINIDSTNQYSKDDKIVYTGTDAVSGITKSTDAVITAVHYDDANDPYYIIQRNGPYNTKDTLSGYIRKSDQCSKFEH